MARKGQFKKGGGRHGDSSSKAIVRYRSSPPVVVTRYKTRPPVKKAKRGRRRGDSGSIAGKLIPILGTAAVLGYVSGEGNMPEVTDIVKKIPGAKTIGTPAAIGGALLLTNKFIFRNRWVKLAGVLGVAIGAYQLGAKKFDFEWLGDPDDGEPMD